MDVSRIAPAVLTEDRLDASYYGTRYLDNEAFLKKCGLPLAPVGDLTDRCNCGATPKEVVYDGKGIGLVRTTDVRPNVFLAEGVLRTGELRVSADASVAAVSGDLLYTMSGTIGYAAVVHDGLDVFSFSNTVARARFSARSGQDARFTAAFFNCKYGYTQSLRLVSGGIQGHVMPNPFKRLPVPTPHVDAQRYIGDKIRQAEHLQKRARTLELAAGFATFQLVRDSANAQDTIQKLMLCVAGKQEQRKRLDSGEGSARRFGALRSRVAPSAMFGRLNAEAYKQEFLDNDRLLRASGWTLSRLGNLVAAPINNSIRGVTEHLSPDHRGVPMFRPADIEGLWMSNASAPRISAAFEQEHAKARVQPGDIVLAIAGTVAAVGRIRESVTYGNINGSSARVRIEGPLRGFVLLFLSSPFGRRELMRWAVGSVQKHLNLEDLPEIRVPEPPVELCEPFEAALQLSGRASECSKALLAAATSLVEQLIEGKVSEGDLVAAQKALEAGDRSADAEILKALRQSDAQDATPLIADLDGLYALLDDLESRDT